MMMMKKKTYGKLGGAAAVAVAAGGIRLRVRFRRDRSNAEMPDTGVARLA